MPRRPLPLPVAADVARGVVAGADRARERLAALFDALPLPVVTVDGSGRVQSWSPAAERVFGWPAAEVLGRPLPIVPPGAEPQFQANLRRVLAGEVVAGVEARRLTRDGTLLDVVVSAAAWSEEGGETLVTAFIDLADRDRSEEGRRRSEEKFRAAFDHAPFGMEIVGADRLLRETNRALVEMVGYVPGDLWGRDVSALDTDRGSRAREAELFAALASGERPGYSLDKKLRRRSGDELWARVHVAPVRDDGGELRFAVGIVEDVTVARATEEALRRVREREALLARVASDALWDWELASGSLWWSDGLYDRFGYSHGDTEPGIAFWSEAIHPDDRPRVLERLQAVLEGDHGGWQDEYRFRRADGSYAWVMDRGQVVRDEAGRARRMVGALIDASERHEMEEALRESEERYRHLVELSPDGVVVWTEEEILYANGAAARVMGFERPADLLGRRLEDLVHADMRGAVAERSLEAFRGGSVRRQVVERYLRVDGREVYLEISSAPMTFKGRPARQVVLRDLSPRVHAEAELRRNRGELRRLAAHLDSVREEEQARIGQEIHDELGQSLTGLKLDLAWLRRRLAGGRPNVPELVERIDDMVRLADEAMTAMRQLSRDLRPPALDDLGLGAAVEWQVEEFRRRSGLECALHLAIPDVIEPHTATSLYRILQEALTNVARHAAATRVEVELARQDANLRLTVIDDGRGFRLGDLADRATLGRLSMHERARACGGRLDIWSEQGKGTRVVAVVPLANDHLEETT